MDKLMELLLAAILIATGEEVSDGNNRK